MPLAAPAMAKDAQAYHLFVWRVTPPGAPADVHADYLIGTMHLPVPPGKAMPAPVKTLIGAASHVVTEADTNDVSPELVAKYAVLKGKKNLQQLLPPAAWQKLLKAAKPMGLAPEQLRLMEPWFLTLGLTMPAPDGQAVIDALIEDEAELQGVEVGYLETAAEQLAMMDSIRQDEDVSQLVEALDEPLKAKQQLTQLRASYFAGDAKGIEALALAPAMVKRYPDFYAKLIFNRNARWVPKVEKLFADEDAVVAVGLAHLLGEQGLVTRLKAKGYRVEPLPL
jgi:uncharacterized protein YbaP (TraB family)